MTRVENMSLIFVEKNGPNLNRETKTIDFAHTENFFIVVIP